MSVGSDLLCRNCVQNGIFPAPCYQLRYETPGLFRKLSLWPLIC